MLVNLATVESDQAVSTIPNQTVRDISASPFTYGMNEQQILLSTFDENDNFGEGWILAPGVAVENGELISASGEWQTANYDLAPLNNLDLDNGSFSLYWSARGERTKTESAKFFIEANLLPPSAGESELKMTVRPSVTGVNAQNEYHQLSVDPGFQVPHIKDAFLHVWEGQFPDPNTYEQFRLTVEKTDADTVEVSPFYWDREQSLWQPFADFLDKTLTSDDWTPPVPTPMSLSITDDLFGLDNFDSLTLRFRAPGYSGIDAFAITSTVPVSEIGEFGTISDLDRSVQTIPLEGIYPSPVIIAPAIAYSGSQPAAIRLRDFTNNSFEVYLVIPKITPDSIASAKNVLTA